MKRNLSVNRVAQLWLQRVATKSDYEKEDEEVRRLQRPPPKKKPPRHDLRRETIKEDDKDTRTQGADEDRDLSLNYKRIASIDNLTIRYLFALDDRAAKATRKQKVDKLAPGKYDNKTSTGKWRSKNQDGTQKYFETKDEAEKYAETNDPSKEDKPGGETKDPDKPAPEEKGDSKPEKEEPEADDKEEEPEAPAKPKSKSPRQQHREERQKGLDDMRGQMKSLFGAFETPEEKKLKAEKATLDKQAEVDKATKEKLENKLKPIKDLHAQIKKLDEEIKLKDDDKYNDPYRSRGYGGGSGGDSLSDIFDSDEYQDEAIEPDADEKDAELKKLMIEKADLVATMKEELQKASKEQEELKEVEARMQISKDRGYEVDDKLRDMGGGYSYGRDEDESATFTLKQDEAATHARKSFESMSEADQVAAAAAYRDAIKTMTDDWSDSGLSDAHVSMAVKALKKPFAGVSKASPEERGRMMAEYAFARRFVLDPAVVSGHPVSDQEESREQMEARAIASMKVYDRMTPELRGEAAEMVSKQLAQADPDSPEYSQLMAVAHGLYVAALMVVDEDGRPESLDIKDSKGERLFPVPSEKASALARTLKKNGDVGLMFAPPGKFFEPEGREAVGRALDSLNDNQLKDAVSDDWKEILDLLTSVDEYGLPVVSSEIRNFVRGFLKSEAINDMTTVQGFVEATCKANGIDDVKAIFEEGRKMRGALKNNKDLKADREALQKCIMEAGADQDSIDACHEQAKERQVKALQAVQDHVEKTYDKHPDPTDPSVARARAAVKNKDPEALDLKLQEPEKGAE